MLHAGQLLISLLYYHDSKFKAWEGMIDCERLVQAIDCSIQTEDCVLLHKDTQTKTKHTTDSATQTSFPQTMTVYFLFTS